MIKSIMSRNKFTLSYLILLTALLVISCKTHVPIELEKLPKMKDAELEAALREISDFHFSTFYSKIAMDYKDSARKVSFKTSLRMVRDSALNGTITYASIPIVTSLITPDSVFISNKREKCYIEESMAYFKQSFGVSFTYINLEELLLGKPVGYDADNKYHRTRDHYKYILTTHKEKDIRKLERRGEKELILSYWISNDLETLRGMRIESLEDTALIEIDYLERQWIDSLSVPSKAKIRIYTPKQEIVIDMDYNKARLNEEETIHYVVPDKYEKCN